MERDWRIDNLQCINHTVVRLPLLSPDEMRKNGREIKGGRWREGEGKHGAQKRQGTGLRVESREEMEEGEQ